MLLFIYHLAGSMLGKPSTQPWNALRVIGTPDTHLTSASSTCTNSWSANLSTTSQYGLWRSSTSPSTPTVKVHATIRNSAEQQHLVNRFGYEPLGPCTRMVSTRCSLQDPSLLPDVSHDPIGGILIGQLQPPSRTLGSPSSTVTS